VKKSGDHASGYATEKDAATAAAAARHQSTSVQG